MTALWFASAEDLDNCFRTAPRGTRLEALIKPDYTPKLELVYTKTIKPACAIRIEPVYATQI